MKTTDATQLFQEVNQLHDANVANATKSVENAIKIGVNLHQIKEIYGHGEFLPAMEKNAPAISERCSRNYMRLAAERLIEEKARLLITEGPAVKSATVADLPTAGKDAPSTESLVTLPENAIPSDCYEQARKEVDEMSWVKLPSKLQTSLYKNIQGKDLMALYRDYGIVRAKELKVYHPQKPLTPDEQIAAENADAEALLASAERAFDAILLDLNAKTSILAARIKPARLKEFLRRAVVVNKRLRPLSSRKQSPAEKKKSNNAAAIKARWEKAKAATKTVKLSPQGLPVPPHQFSAYVNKWGRLVVKAYSLNEEIEALRSGSVYAVIRCVEAENLDSAYTEATRRYSKRHCDITLAAEGQTLPVELKR